MWGPMLDKVWSFLRGDAPEGLYEQGHNIMLYKDDVPNVEVGVQVSGSFDPAGHVVASALPGGLVATAPTPARSPRSATLIRRCASGARRTGTGWPALAGRSTAIPPRRPATSMWTCSGRWWRRNPGIPGGVVRRPVGRVSCRRSHLPRLGPDPADRYPRPRLGRPVAASRRHVAWLAAIACGPSGLRIQVEGASPEGNCQVPSRPRLNQVNAAWPPVALRAGVDFAAGRSCKR